MFFWCGELLKKAGLLNPLQVVRNGEKPCYLKGEGTYANRGGYPLPSPHLLAQDMRVLGGSMS